MSSGKREVSEALVEGGSFAFLPSGEMARLVRAMDWSETRLGSIEKWPQELRTTVSLAPPSNFPIKLIWGPDYY
jgi:hypothetical protein